MMRSLPPSWLIFPPNKVIMSSWRASDSPAKCQRFASVSISCAAAVLFLRLCAWQTSTRVVLTEKVGVALSGL